MENMIGKRIQEYRKKKGVTPEEAAKVLSQANYFGTMLVKMGLADSLLGGATYSTADTVRPALQLIKTKPGKKVVTGGTLMLKENCNPLFFGDVSLIEQPTSEQLAEIAVASAEFMQKVVDVEPKVAILPSKIAFFE